MIVLIFLLLTLCFIWAAERWGVDSRDNIDSIEWEKRRNYPRYPL